jgi:hypothetical protein
MAKSRPDAKPMGRTRSRPPMPAPDAPHDLRAKPVPAVELDDSGLPITR